MKKVLLIHEAKKIALKLRLKKKILVAHGVFDVLHIGHLKYFEEIKKKYNNSILFVTITADKYVNKGPSRPMFNQFQRAEMLSSLKLIDYVVIIDDYTAVQSIKNIKPNYYFKGKEYKNAIYDQNLKLEKKALDNISSKLEFIDTKKFSSSEIINNKFDQFDEKTKNFLKNLNKEFNHKVISNIMNSLEKIKIAVIGEAIIDEYIYIKPLNKSPKENLITNLFERSQSFAGGSLAVANNLACFSKNVSLYSLLGKNPNPKNFLKKSLNKNIKKKNYFFE